MSEINDVISKICSRMAEQLSSEQADLLKHNLAIILNDYSVLPRETALAVIDENTTAKAIQMFFVSKKMEGCTDKTLSYYRFVIRKFFSLIPKDITAVSADDVRLYLATRYVDCKLSKTSQDNELRVLKSFFKWCFGDKYIAEIPTLNIKAVKQEKRIKKPFTEKQIELLRETAAQPNGKRTEDKLKSARTLAIIDVLFSTGVRVTELVGMNITDLQPDEIVVFGKGEKERTVYLNTRAQLNLEKYLNLRTDDNDALFVGIRSPHNRMTAAVVETEIRELGKLAGVPNTHPHRFRRTAATLALNRGMPIEQVSKMLGHEDLKTTSIYAKSSDENVKASHKKYVI